jgi:hypothetical protein
MLSGSGGEDGDVVSVEHQWLIFNCHQGHNAEKKVLY